MVDFKQILKKESSLSTLEILKRWYNDIINEFTEVYLPRKENETLLWDNFLIRQSE